MLTRPYPQKSTLCNHLIWSKHIYPILRNIGYVDTFDKAYMILSSMATYYQNKKTRKEIDTLLRHTWKRFEKATNNRITGQSLYHTMYNHKELRFMPWEDIFRKQQYPTNVKIDQYPMAYTMYPISNDGGMSPQCIDASHMLHMRHYTYFDTFKKMIDEGLINTRDPRTRCLNNQDEFSNKHYRYDQYPGVYMSLYTKYSSRLSDIEQLQHSELVLIVSLAPLISMGWHTNLNEDYGIMSGLTWDSYTFPKLLAESDPPKKMEEVIFHYPVPFDYVEAIVVSRDHFQKVKDMVDENIPVLTPKTFSVLSNTRFTRGIYEPYIGNTSPARLVYKNYSMYEDRILDKSVVYGTLLNSGLIKDDVKYIIGTYSDNELKKLLEQLWLEDIYELPSYPAIHPPY